MKGGVFISEMNNNKKSVQVRIPVWILEQVDEFANRTGTNRSNVINTALLHYLQDMNFQSIIRELTLAIQRLAIKGNNDEETIKQIEILMSALEIFQKKDDK